MTLDIVECGWGGLLVGEVIRLATEKANRDNQYYEIMLNDITLYISPESYYGDICKIYDLKREIERLKLKY